MPFEGEKFEEIPTPPPEEEKEEEIEEEKLEGVELEKEKIEEREEKISPEEEKIYQQYREIEEKQKKLEEALREEFEKDKKEIAKEFGVEVEDLDEVYPQWREDPRVKRFEKESKKIEEMKNPLKKEILKKFKEVDPEAPEKMIEELKKRREELGEEIWKIGEMTRGTGHTEMLEEEKEEIERVVKDFENKDLKSLRDFTKQELRRVFTQVIGDEWRGKEGFERLKRAIFLKKVLNTLERK